MKMTELFRAAWLALGLALAIFPAGCKRSLPPEAGPAPQESRPIVPGPKESAPKVNPVKVQLWDPTAEVMLEVVQNRHVFTAHCKVKYRFVEGAPQAGMWYNFEAEMKDVGVAIKPLEGSAMKTEGELEQTVPLLPVSDLGQLKKANVQEIEFDPAQVPKEVVFQIQQGTGKNGPFRSIGDKVRCALKTKTTYPIP
jgi:hypothetical protein